MTNSTPVGLIAGHGDFAAGLLSAVEQITGLASRFVGMTNRGLGAADIERVMRALVDAHDARIIFTDLPAGSCTIAAARVLRAVPGRLLVTGVSLPVLLHFVNHGELPPAEVAASAIERGCGALRIVAGWDGDADGH